MKKQSPKPIAITLSDIHLHENNIKLVKDVFEQTIELVKQYGFTYFIFKGDLFHSRKSMPQVLQEAFEDILEMLGNIEMITIPGNHDKTDYNSCYSFLNVFKYHKGFDLITTWDKRDIVEGISFWFLPFFHEKNGNYISKLDDMLKYSQFTEEKNILFTHCGINNALLPSGKKHEGLIGRELFKKFDKVFVGHFHNVSEFDNISYTGAGFQHDFSEDEDKGPVLIYDDFSWRRLKINFPKYIKKEIHIVDVKVNKKHIQADIQNDLEKGDHVWVHLLGSETELKSANLKVLQDMGVKLSYKSDSIIEEGDYSNVELHTYDNEKIIDEFKTFCDKNGLTFEEGKQILEEANIK